MKTKMSKESKIVACNCPGSKRGRGSVMKCPKCGAEMVATESWGLPAYVCPKCGKSLPVTAPRPNDTEKAKKREN